MRRLAIIVILLMATAASGSYLGSWKIDDYLPITATTHRFSTGMAYDASSITYRIYEDETEIEIVGDTSMTKFDNQTGFYLNREQLTDSKGFEQGKCYTVFVKATVDGVSGTVSHIFQIKAEVNAPDVLAIMPTPEEIRAEIDANSTQLALILADTNELQVDWTDGGRLDLLVDAIKAMTDLIAVVTTTVSEANDANSFTITAGLDVNDAYWMHIIMVEDATDSHRELRFIEEWLSTRVVLLDEPLGFTPDVGDNVWIMGTGYGGFLYEIRSALAASKQPVYYYDTTTAGGRGGAGGTSYYDQTGDDP